MEAECHAPVQYGVQARLPLLSSSTRVHNHFEGQLLGLFMVSGARLQIDYQLFDPGKLKTIDH
jgi:hypothetical protein